MNTENFTKINVALEKSKSTIFRAIVETVSVLGRTF